MNKKNIALAALAATLTVAGCRKDRFEDVSEVVTVSYPTITFSGSGQFISIPVGGAVPQISATAYDSTIGEAYAATVGENTVDPNTPGLYVIVANATNKFGYIGFNAVYVAVTDVDPAMDLSGLYVRNANGQEANVTELANGLYQTDNVGGSTLTYPAYFAVLNDSTIDLPLQPILGTSVATTVGVSTPEDPQNYGFLSLAPGDTTIAYAFTNGDAGFATGNTRTFTKQ